MAAALRWFFRPTPASVLCYAETAGLLLALAIRAVS